MGHDVLCAADEGRMSPADCASLMVDYLAPSLDTTISAISSALYLMATHPRVLVLYASANRDPLEWDDPDTFDIRREAGRQLGFGHGTHGCAGQGLARLETSAMLRALVERVDRIEATGRPQWALNNIIHRLERLPLELVPA